MPPIRTHEEVDDDDGMPPLVDNPMDNPNLHPSMSFTFFTDMTPITAYSAEPIYEMAPETSILASPPDSPSFYEGPMPAPADARTSHGKKRDASYIPRPPNAFILFRSSFIRSQQVPGKVEGNHSTLSKIIGKYWKTLPREEREVWEGKALIAQAEHRKRYPDWRFRPGSNALAKLKVKDGGTNRKRNSQSNRKGKGDGEVKEKSDEKRCAKIADFLVEGKKGLDLEAALKEWEGNSTNGDEVKGDEVKGETKAVNESEHGNVAEGVGHKLETTKARLGQDKAIVLMSQDAHNITNDIGARDKADIANNSAKSRCLTPEASPDLRFKVPLTAMFKRSLSAPASQMRSPAQNTFSSSVQATRRGSFASPMPHMLSFPYEASVSPLLPIEQHEAIPRAVSDDTASEMSLDCLSPLTMSPTFERGTLAHWSDPFDLPMGSPAGPDTPGFVYDAISPTPSPVMDMFTGFNLTSPVPANNTNSVQGGHDATTVEDGEMYHQPHNGYDSSFSTLKGWAGDMTYKRTSPRIVGELSFVPPFINDSGIVDTAIRDYGWPQAMYDGSYRSTEMQHLQHYPNGLNAFIMNSAVGLV